MIQDVVPDFQLDGQSHQTTRRFHRARPPAGHHAREGSSTAVLHRRRRAEHEDVEGRCQRWPRPRTTSRRRRQGRRVESGENDDDDGRGCGRRREADGGDAARGGDGRGSRRRYGIGGNRFHFLFFKRICFFSRWSQEMETQIIESFIPFVHCSREYKIIRLVL